MQIDAAITPEPTATPAPAADLAGRHLLVVGLGESGLAMARWGARVGARVTVLDDRETPAKAADLQRLAPQARRITAPLAPPALQVLIDAGDKPDLVAWSPGLSSMVGPTAALREAALAAGIPVLGELDFFAAELARRAVDGYAPKVVAITGTNGKTTVTQLAEHLGREAGLDALAAGNISPALLDALADRIDAGRLPDLWALELSSFQLATAGAFVCDASVVLNVTQDHLDWHGSMAHYRASKLRIHAGSRCRIANADDRLTDPAFELAAPVADPAPADKAMAETGRKHGGRGRVKKPLPPPPADVTFSTTEPAAAPAFGLVRDGGLTWLVEALPDEEGTGTGRRRRDAGGFRLNRLMPADALRLVGEHNHANAVAALALLRAAGVPMGAMLRGLRDFEAGAHRCTAIATINDVTFYDDSKGTNVGATVAALSGLGRPAVLIAGGLGKGQEFAPLAPAVRRHARAVVLIGRDAPAIRAALAETGIPMHDASDMDAAVDQAAALARPGDAVLMSPACASFDMFKGYGHRGEVFAAAVRRRADEAGQP